MNKQNSKINDLQTEIHRLEILISNLTHADQLFHRKKLIKKQTLLQNVKRVNKQMIEQYQKEYPFATGVEAAEYFKLPSVKHLNQIIHFYRLNAYANHSKKNVITKNKSIEKNKYISPQKNIVTQKKAVKRNKYIPPTDEPVYSSWQNGKYIENGTKAVYSRKGICSAEELVQNQKLNDIIGKPITIEGYKNYQDELAQLKSNDLHRLKKMFENAESTFEKQEVQHEYNLVNSRISELETLLAVSVIIEKKKNKKKKTISIGNRVTILDLSEQEELCYLIGGPTESNIELNVISSISPLGKALIGKKSGQQINYESPGGLVNIKIIKFE